MAGGEQLVLQASAETALLFPVAWERYTLLPRVDLICAGVPCQDVSIAGQRRGLSGSRTGLFYEFARLLKELRPAWFVFENVPGLFSSNQGREGLARTIMYLVRRLTPTECETLQGFPKGWTVPAIEPLEMPLAFPSQNGSQKGSSA